jgi:hypothetical protein
MTVKRSYLMATVALFKPGSVKYVVVFDAAGYLARIG